MTDSNSNNSIKTAKKFNGQWEVVLACDVESPNIAVAVEVFDIVWGQDKGLVSQDKSIKVINVPGCMNDFSYSHHVIIAKWSKDFKYTDFMVCNTCGKRLIGATGKCEECFKREWEAYTSRCKVCATFRDAGTCADCLYDLCPIDAYELEEIKLFNTNIMKAIAKLELDWYHEGTFYFRDRDITVIIFGEDYNQEMYNIVVKAVAKLLKAGCIVPATWCDGFAYTRYSAVNNKGEI